MACVTFSWVYFQRLVRYVNENFINYTQAIQ
jgi:hypothetical protein